MPVYAESSSLARSQPAARTMHYRLPSPPTSTSNTGVLDPYVLCDTCPMNTPPLCAAIWVPFKTMYGWSVSGLCPCVAREARFKKDSSRAESANVAGSALGSPRLRRSELPRPTLSLPRVPNTGLHMQDFPKSARAARARAMAIPSVRYADPRAGLGASPSPPSPAPRTRPGRAPTDRRPQRGRSARRTGPVENMFYSTLIPSVLHQAGYLVWIQPGRRRAKRSGENCN